MPAQSRQTALPSGRRPGSNLSVLQAGHRPRTSVAFAKQVRQIGLSGQLAALAARRPQRAQSRMCQRWYSSAVMPAGLTGHGKAMKGSPPKRPPPVCEPHVEGVDGAARQGDITGLVARVWETV